MPDIVLCIIADLRVGQSQSIPAVESRWRCDGSVQL